MWSGCTVTATTVSAGLYSRALSSRIFTVTPSLPGIAVDGCLGAFGVDFPIGVGRSQLLDGLRDHVVEAHRRHLVAGAVGFGQRQELPYGAGHMFNGEGYDQRILAGLLEVAALRRAGDDASVTLERGDRRAQLV